MSAKRALIVDDSRSARVILTRMLEQHGLQVDTAESGEQALDYLRSARPDVVFMDHLMPGMDGFEAVRAIKSNNATAAIPVMMYTSQEGEPYLQQARKVGAVGVLSKTLKQTDVARALYGLHLLPDRRDLREPTAQARAPEAAREPFERAMMEAAASAVAASPASPHAARESTPQERGAKDIDAQALRAALTPLVNDQQAEQQQLLHASFELLRSRLLEDLRLAVQHVQVTLQSQTRQSGRRGVAWTIALVLFAFVPAAVLAVLYWRTLDDNQAQLVQSNARMAMVVTDQQTQIEQLRAELRRRQDAFGDVVAEGVRTQTVEVPYGELPLSGPRVQRLRSFLEELQAEEFHGTVRVGTYVGDFCLSGNAVAGYQPASETLPIRSCDLIGNPFEDGLTAVTRQSHEFAALIATVADSIPIDVVMAGRKPIERYPPRNDKLTAGAWNRVAAHNNRVEFVALPGQ